MTGSVIIGSRDDVHVRHVLELLERGAHRAIVVNAESIESARYRITPRTFALSDITEKSHARGWIRRYAPDGWLTSCELGSLEGVTNRARLTLLNHIAGSPDVEWLTPRWRLTIAEERIFQLEVAEKLGIQIPRSIVSNDLNEIGEYLGEEFVAKPIGASVFSHRGELRVVYATAMTLNDAMKFDWSAAPFVVQQKLEVRTHFRVVTVGRRAWIAYLGAEGRPLDWRQQSEAHESWHRGGPEQVVDLAIKLVSEMELGYSSQDWVGCDDGLYFLDLNPAGQWLFLPEPIASEVTAAIADFLKGVI